MERQYSIFFGGHPRDNETIESVVESYIRLFECMDNESDVITDIMIAFKIKCKWLTYG